MNLDDLTAVAKAWIEDHQLPEPDGLKLTRTGRIELNYVTPVSLPDLGWHDSSDGSCRVHIADVDGITVSVYQLKEAVTT